MKHETCENCGIWENILCKLEWGWECFSLGFFLFYRLINTAQHNTITSKSLITYSIISYLFRIMHVLLFFAACLIFSKLLANQHLFIKKHKWFISADFVIHIKPETRKVHTSTRPPCIAHPSRAIMDGITLIKMICHRYAASINKM